MAFTISLLVCGIVGHRKTGRAVVAHSVDLGSGSDGIAVDNVLGSSKGLKALPSVL